MPKLRMTRLWISSLISTPELAGSLVFLGFLLIMVVYVILMA